jgi:NTE family protein
MASGALPIFFPAVQVGNAWCGDGGIRMSAPLSPAIHLGADCILAISPRYQRSQSEIEAPNVEGYPPPVQVVGALFNAIFLDVLDNDVLRLERMNRILQEVPPERRGELRPVKLLLLRPSRDLGLLASDYETELPAAFRFMTRGLGTQQTRSNDILSFVIFQRDYLQKLVALGYEDAERNRAQIENLLPTES